VGISALFFILALVAGSMRSVPALSAEPPSFDKSSPFGVVANLGNRVRSDEFPAAVELMREAGVQWQREEIFWDRVQQSPDGPFTWDGDGNGFYNYDAAIEAQVNAGIQVVGLLDYNPAWFKSKNPPPDAWMEDWGDFVYNAVARYGRDRGWIKHWQLWNEPNVRESGYESGLYEIKDFVEVLRVGRAAALAADPEAKIVMGGISGILRRPEPFNYDCFDYFNRVGQAGGWQYADILAIHIYQPAPPEVAVERYDRVSNFRGELHHLNMLMQRYGTKPVWITEFGWGSNNIWPGVTHKQQALFLVRAYVLALAHPSVEKIFWYDFRNDNWPHDPYEIPSYDLYEINLHFGLLRRTYPLDPARSDLRKPAFLAYRAMTQMLTGMTLQEVRDEGVSGIYWYRFARSERRVDVLWRTRKRPLTLDVACNCREALVRSWDGRVQQILTPRGGKIAVHLARPDEPLYVEYDPTSPIQDGTYFETTGHWLRGRFRDYWQTYGGHARFGYPLTDELIEPDATSGRPRVVQYFERARFEHHPENGATPDEVQISKPAARH
jgi:hypothetical protein